jgi:uncharacterized membrane protein
MLTRGQFALRLGILALSFAGYLDALYLTLAHYRRVIPSCSLTRGCEEVLTSRFASMFGIPTAVLGLAFYLVTYYLAVVTITYSDDRYRLALKLGAGAGFLASALLFLAQALVIRAYCQYCVASAIAALGIFLLSLFMRGEADRTPTWW